MFYYSVCNCILGVIHYINLCYLDDPNSPPIRSDYNFYSSLM